MPKVSVIIPTHNRADSLRSAIASVLSQTFQDFEIIVVDDASKDNTAEAVRGFADKRIKYIRHDSNKREAGSRNTGLTHANGEYIAFLDDDDEWLPRKLKMQVELLDSSPPKVGAVYTGFLKIQKATSKFLIQIIPTRRGDIFQDMLIQNWVGTPSTVILRKGCFERVGLFDEGIAFGPDYDMWIRISKEFHFEFIKELLVNYFVHDDNLSTNYDLMIKGNETLLAKYAPSFASNRKGYSQRYASLGVLYCYNQNTAKAREAFLKAIKIYPLEVRYYVSFFLSLLGAGTFKRLNETKEKVKSKVGELFLRQSCNE